MAQLTSNGLKQVVAASLRHHTAVELPISRACQCLAKTSTRLHPSDTPGSTLPPHMIMQTIKLNY